MFFRYSGPSLHKPSSMSTVKESLPGTGRALVATLRVRPGPRLLRYICSLWRGMGGIAICHTRMDLPAATHLVLSHRFVVFHFPFASLCDCASRRRAPVPSPSVHRNFLLLAWRPKCAGSPFLLLSSRTLLVHPLRYAPHPCHTLIFSCSRHLLYSSFQLFSLAVQSLSSRGLLATGRGGPRRPARIAARPIASSALNGRLFRSVAALYLQQVQVVAPLSALLFLEVLLSLMSSTAIIPDSSASLADHSHHPCHLSDPLVHSHILPSTLLARCAWRTVDSCRCLPFLVDHRKFFLSTSQIFLAQQDRRTDA